MKPHFPHGYQDSPNKNKFISDTASRLYIDPDKENITFNEFTQFLEGAAKSNNSKDVLSYFLKEGLPFKPNQQIWNPHSALAYIESHCKLTQYAAKRTAELKSQQAHADIAHKAQKRQQQKAQESVTTTPAPPLEPPDPNTLRTPFDLIDLKPYTIRNLPGTENFCLTKSNGHSFRLSKRCFDTFSDPNQSPPFSQIVGNAARNKNEIYFSAVPPTRLEEFVPKIVCSPQEPSNEDREKSDKLCRKIRECLERGFVISSGGDMQNVRVQIRPRQEGRTSSELSLSEEHRNLLIPITTLETLAQLLPVTQPKTHKKKSQRSVQIANGRLAIGQVVNFPHQTSIEQIGSNDYTITFAKGTVSEPPTANISRGKGRSNAR